MSEEPTGGAYAVSVRSAFVRLAALEAQYREATAAHAAGHAAREERLRCERDQLARENDALRGHVDELTAALRALGVTRQFGLCWCRTLAGWYCVGQSHCRAAARALEGTP
jgi:hypothetical protein